MKTIHLNEEYIKGFVDALFSELDEGLGPQLKYLEGYDLLFEKKELWTVRIPFAVQGSTRDNLVTYFDLSARSTVPAFRLKVKLCFEEITNHIASFQRDPFQFNNPGRDE